MKRIFTQVLAAACCLLLSGCSAAIPEPAASLSPAQTSEPTATNAVLTPEPEPTVNSSVYDAYQPAKEAALTGLRERLESYSDCLYVYKDFALTENNFTQKAKIFGASADLVHDMDENWTDNAYAGDSCIRCQVDTRSGDWGGWLFLNGYLPDGETVARLNDGKQTDAGMDLHGATELRFFAKGETGEETVEFFTLGFGYDGESGKRLAEYPDSARKRSLGFIQLTSEWKEYVIDLGQLDLSYICCGFGFVLSGSKSLVPNNVFYLDEIRFVGGIAYAKNAHVMMRSYDTDNLYIKNAAFSYDNALVAMAFLSEGMTTEGCKLLDSFVYAVEHDRQGVSRVRNAYASGIIDALPGWGSSARVPGWYDFSIQDTGEWYEDQYQVGSNVGNTSYVALALLHGYQQTSNKPYLDTAKALMDWVIENCSDRTIGFTAGFDGWAEGKTPQVYLYTYKSIEHNIDAYAAFAELFALTGEARYQAASQSALQFIESMYDPSAGVFYTGTTNDGITQNRDNIVLDAQVWAAMALGDAFVPYETALDRVQGMRVSNGGYPFCESNVNGGWWAEGTAYTALLYRLRANDVQATAALDALQKIQLSSGLFPAATVENLSTGFELFTGEPWVYGTAPHIAPTAWFILAVNGWNPYQF
ncbi:MAG: hypothetical protein VB034_08285 [Eubacteriales bacterium]|nr:hypothetical protein [Eubacteriales bacterium]